MKYIVTAEEMKRYDANTIQVLGIPGMVLMERASLSVYQILRDKFAGSGLLGKKVLIMVGVGNNGGDGLALARMLSKAGCKVWVFVVGKEDRATEQWRLQRDILKHFPVSFVREPHLLEYDVMIDALFGIGVSRKLEKEYEKWVQWFNDTKAYKVALDLPSGIDTDTGSVKGCAVRADLTVTFGFQKRGLVFFPGCEYAGKVVVGEMGIGEESFLGKPPTMFTCEENPMDLLPKRQKNGHKGTFGKVLLVAGSLNMAGAAVLSAKAAYRSGAGMVRVLTAEENRLILQTAVPEALFGTLDEIEKGLEWADVVAIGPGISTSGEARECLKKILLQSNCPLLIDADGLNLLAQEEDLVNSMKRACEGGREVVLTPHVAELSRLCNRPLKETAENLLTCGKTLAEELGAVVVAKDARTLICAPAKNQPVFVNLRGNSGMATAGSGDVLSGLTIGLMAQGMSAWETAVLGASLHAYLGDKAARRLGEHACMAGDLIDAMDMEYT